MEFLFDCVAQLKNFQKLNSYAKLKGAVAVTALNSGFKSNIIGTLCHYNDARAFCVAGDEKEAQVFCNDLCMMGYKACVYPQRDFNFREVSGISREYEHQRLKVLTKLLTGECDIVVGTIDALLQYTIPPEVLKKATLHLKQGQQISTEQCVEALNLLGYERTDK
jgi:transcription-repair coupling factor